MAQKFKWSSDSAGAGVPEIGAGFLAQIRSGKTKIFTRYGVGTERSTIMLAS
jgi:hypothetical protein